MFDSQLLMLLARERQQEIYREYAICRRQPTLRALIARALVAVGAFVVCLGTALDDERDRRPETVSV